MKNAISGKDAMPVLEAVMRDALRKDLRHIAEGVKHVNELHAQRGLKLCSPRDYLEWWKFEEPEITELLKKAGYVV